MASKDHDDHGYTETDEETLAMKRKRSRRVSFADREITSVHIFNRDEDYETPPEPKPSSDSANPDLGLDNQVFSFLKDLGDDSKDSSPSESLYDDEEDGVAARKSFLRPMESPSPGSSAFGSATSIDEDDFFGPVSANFIRLSDSAASDDNHDVTMDSTAFSMHFRSLARSESGDQKTPTGISLAFEEKTPTQNITSTGPGNSMVLSKAKKLFAQTSLPVDKVSGGKDSNDMSLVGVNPRRYDYDELSPTLAALLAEGSKDGQDVSVSNISKLKTLNTSTHDMDVDSISISPNVRSKATDDSITATGTLTDGCGPAADSFIDHQISTPSQLISGSNVLTKDPTGTSGSESEYPAITSSTPSDMCSKVLQLDMPMQHESEHKTDPVKEKSPTDRAYPDTDLKSDQQNGSPSVGSISSSARQRQISLDSNSSRHHSAVTSSPKQPSFFISKESIKHSAAVLKIEQSVGKSRSFESSPYSSMPKDEVEIAQLKPYDSPSITCPFDNVLIENSEDLHHNRSIACLKNNVSSLDLKEGESYSMTDMDYDGVVTPVNSKSVDTVRQGEETTGLANGEPLHPMSVSILSKDEPDKLTTSMASPLQFTWSGRKRMQHLSMPENITGQRFFTSEMESPLVTLDNEKNVKVAGSPDKFVSSPLQVLHQKSSASQSYQGSFPSALKLQDQFNRTVTAGSEHHGDPMEIVTGGSHSTATPDNIGGRINSISSFEMDHFEDLINLDGVNDREINFHHSQKEPDTLRNFQTPSRDRDILDIQSGSQYMNLQTQTEPTRSRKKHFHEVIKASSCGSASPFLPRRITDDSSLQKASSKVKLFRSPIWKESTEVQSKEVPYNVSHNDNKECSVGKVTLPTNPISDAPTTNDRSEGLHISQIPFPVQDIDNSSGRKRSREEVALDNGLSKVLISRIQRRPEVDKGMGCDLELEHYNGSENERKKSGHDTSLKHWTDIILKFSGDTEEMHSPVIENLNIRAIGLLEDIISQLQRVKIYDTLGSEISSQKTFDQSSISRLKRVADTRLLLYKIMYETAKMQLMCVKRKRLLKRVQLLSSGTQESQMLKLHHVRPLCLPIPRDAQVEDRCSGSHLENIEGKHEVTCNKMIRMRQEFESLDRKIQSITKSFHTYCKLKGEPSYAMTVALVNDHMKNRKCCRLIRQYLQLWQVGDLESKNCQKNIVLDYCGFISQRITICDSPVPSIKISNKYDEAKIVKKFPNMDACTAFAFVLKTETSRKYAGLKSLARETQMISSILRNLLDVIEEVQVARIEIRNLTETSFCSRWDEHLGLQLRFVDFSNGTNVIMTLDVTCLNCGIYPSEALPYSLQVSEAGTKKSLTQSLIAEIKASVESLVTGHSRILKLCRCVSQAMQS